jgi:hypothetical protein
LDEPTPTKYFLLQLPKSTLLANWPPERTKQNADHSFEMIGVASSRKAT